MSVSTTVSNIKHKSLRPYYRMPVLELDYKVSIVDTTKCIITVANKVGVSEMAKQYAVNLIDDVTKKGMSAGKNPMGLAAKLYISCINTNENTSQRVIADAARITEVTLRNRLRDIKSQLHLK
jgi:transcription initiation factor TFIIB